jgi:S1/P1 Nuclease
VKSYDLVWLIHLVGDAHHPLHATSRFTAADPGDNGGNAETVTPANAANESLHAFWDGLLGDRLTPDQAISMAAALPQADPADEASQRSRSTRT